MGLRNEAADDGWTALSASTAGCRGGFSEGVQDHVQ